MSNDRRNQLDPLARPANQLDPPAAQVDGEPPTISTQNLHRKPLRWKQSPELWQAIAAVGVLLALLWATADYHGLSCRTVLEHAIAIIIASIVAAAIHKRPHVT